MRAVRISLLALLLSLVLLPVSPKRARAQADTSTAAAPPPPPPEIVEVVKKQFGPCFQISTQRSPIVTNYLHPPAQKPWVYYFTADVDGDGVEDLVVVARCDNPLIGQEDFHYTVADPYFAANGYGDPRVTSQFSDVDPARNNLVLVLFGAGPEAWRADQPKGKWVLINLPFDTIGFSHVEVGKKKKARRVGALSLEEGENDASLAFFDGRKWKWENLTGN